MSCLYTTNSQLLASIINSKENVYIREEHHNIPVKRQEPKIFNKSRSKQKNYPYPVDMGMNNAIIATVFVAMMMGGGLVTGFVFNMPQDSLIYEKATGESPLDGNNIIEVRASRR